MNTILILLLCYNILFNNNNCISKNNLAILPRLFVSRDHSQIWTVIRARNLLLYLLVLVHVLMIFNIVILFHLASIYYNGFYGIRTADTQPWLVTTCQHNRRGGGRSGGGRPEVWGAVLFGRGWILYRICRENQPLETISRWPGRHVRRVGNSSYPSWELWEFMWVILVR